MARSKSFFGLRRGSTKTLTFSVLKGQQITKDRVEGGRNPRTPEQMVQRMCMATASAAYAQMKQIVDHSFEGITYGQTTMSEFIRVNAEALRQNYYYATPAEQFFSFAYNPYRDRLCYVGNYIMSRGTASPINKIYQVDGDYQQGGYVPDKLQLGVSTGAGVTVTADNVMSKLGFNVGELCTFVGLFEDDTDASMHFYFIRFTAKKNGDVALTSENFEDYFLIESNVPILGVEVQVAGFSVSFTARNWISGKHIECAIHSMKSNGKWLRSNAAFKNNRDEVSPTAEDALATYPIGPSYVLNGGDV